MIYSTGSLTNYFAVLATYVVMIARCTHCLQPYIDNIMHTGGWGDCYREVGSISQAGITRKHTIQALLVPVNPPACRPSYTASWETLVLASSCPTGWWLRFT